MHRFPDGNYALMLLDSANKRLVKVGTYDLDGAMHAAHAMTTDRFWSHVEHPHQLDDAEFDGITWCATVDCGMVYVIHNNRLEDWTAKWLKVWE